MTAEQGFAAYVRAEYDLDPTHRALLDAAEQAYDRWQEIRAAIDRDGVLVSGRYKGAPRANPLLAQEARAREAFARLLRELNLPGEGD